jgi:hypothetical protein
MARPQYILSSDKSPVFTSPIPHLYAIPRHLVNLAADLQNAPHLVDRGFPVKLLGAEKPYESRR